MDLTVQVGAFYYPVSCQSEVEVHTSDSRNPLEALLPVAAHLVQPPTPLAWLGKESALLFTVIHTEAGEQHTQTQRLPVSTLTHPGSISWLQRQTLLLFSHADCNDFTPELQYCFLPYSAALSHTFIMSFFFLLLLLLPVTFPHSQGETWLLLGLCLAGFTAWIPHLRQKGCMSEDASALAWDSDRKRRKETWRSGNNWFGWVSTSSRNYHRQRPCRQRVEPVEQNCSQVVQEMNL